MSQTLKAPKPQDHSHLKDDGNLGTLLSKRGFRGFVCFTDIDRELWGET